MYATVLVFDSAFLGAGALDGAGAEAGAAEPELPTDGLSSLTVKSTASSNNVLNCSSEISVAPPLKCLSIMRLKVAIT